MIPGWTAPDGVTVEQLPSIDHCFAIGRDGYWVTVDFKNRIYGLGYAEPRKYSATPAAWFSGPGWKKRLLDAAMLHLEEIIA